MPERRGTQALEAWARRATSGYKGVTITNMSTAWRDGLAFCALIHHFRPDLIEFSSLKSENILENNSLAFRIAEQQLGIPALLDAEDMVANPVPDRLSILTYVSQYYRTFSAMGLLAERKQARGKDGKYADDGKADTRGGGGGNSHGCEAESPASRPQITTPVMTKAAETKTDKVLGRGGRARRESCVSCQETVFLAERMLVGAPGQLMHRTCFRCARCSTQLTLASYYQTERGQYCCETCPDEECLPLPSSHTVDTESDSSSEESDSDDEEEEGDGESETLQLPDTPAPTPSPTPPRPRTVFLSETLSPASEALTAEQPLEASRIQPKQTHFNRVSPALFGDTDKPGRVREHSPDPTRPPCTPKSLRTDPPEILDTGQADLPVPHDSPFKNIQMRSLDTQTRPHSTPLKSTSSIVARRLQMFREMSNKCGQERKSFPEPRMKREVDKESNREVEDHSTIVPSISVTQEILDKGDKDFITPTSTNTTTITTTPTFDTTATQAISVTPQNPFIQEDEEEEDNVKNQHKETRKEDYRPNESHEDTNQTVEEAASDGYQSETENMHEESQTEKTRVENELENTQEKDESYKLVRAYAGVVIESHCESKKDVVVIPVIEQDSGDVEDSVVITPSEQQQTDNVPQEEYPDDLNPFGSEDEEVSKEKDTAQALQSSIQDPLGEVNNKTQTTPTIIAEPPVEPTQDIPSRRLIKANLNPFESDEEEEKTVEKDVFSAKKEGKKSLNPFWSDEEEEEEEEEIRDRKDTLKGAKIKPPRPPPPTLQRNRSPSTLSMCSSTSTTPRKKKVVAPPPPSSPTLSQSSPGGSVALRKKGRRAPKPPQHSTHATPDSLHQHSANNDSHLTLSADREGPDEVLSWKIQKDLKNHSNKINGTPTGPPKPPRSPHTATSEGGVTRHCSLGKSEVGEWKRKKGPAPSRPVPQKRALKKLPMKVIQQELQDIDIKQTELERQGVVLETAIRKRTESSAPPSPQEEAPPSSPPVNSSSNEVEDMILQLFELVNEKNELFRRQTELMYLKREKRLEEEHVELEYQIRCLMLKAPAERTEEDTAQEEDLIRRLVKVVEQRDEIINCLELDRLREAQEDESIATHMMQYQEKQMEGLDNGNIHPEPSKKKKTLKLPKKKKKKKEKKEATGDADKDVDETETPPESKKKKKKKKWLF